MTEGKRGRPAVSVSHTLSSQKDSSSSSSIDDRKARKKQKVVYVEKEEFDLGVKEEDLRCTTYLDRVLEPRKTKSIKKVMAGVVSSI